MDYQAFRGVDVKEAMNAVKSALGPDAMIGSTRFVSNDRPGGLQQSYVEVLAAHPASSRRYSPFAQAVHQEEWNRGKEKELQRRAPRRARVRPAQNLTDLLASPIETQSRADSAAASDAAANNMRDIEQELMTLRAMLEELHRTRPPREQAQALLAGLGIEGTLARELSSGAARSVKQGPEALREYLQAQVARRFEVAPGLLEAGDKQAIACVGPTGAGKTTTLAKLAAKVRLDFGRSAGVISLDTFRVGATEQWQRYAELMGLSVSVASDVDSFEQILQQHTEDVLLIDTPGHVGKARNDWLVARCLDAVKGRPLDTLLVVPAWLGARDVEQITNHYEAAGPTGIVASKVDEAERAGGVLHAAATGRIPFVYLCDGPRVPEDIRDATHEALISAVFKKRP